MGGKKKTKWRKLPLEEFTKEIAPKTEEPPPIDNCQTDVTREENDFIPSYSGPSEIIQNYVEPYEYIDGIWYPTSCVVYNPGLYSNYIMPADSCYYYSTMPEAGQMQEYMPVPYQEYTPALPKDTVYLLLPTQTFRPTPPVQNIAPEWQNRRRRRRYEGYAEYAVIPEKTNPSQLEEKDYSKVPETHANSRRKSVPSSNFGRMSSFSETNSSDDLSLEPNQISEKSNEAKNNPTNIDIEKVPHYLSKEMGLFGSANGQTPKNISEMCGVHSRSKTTAKTQKTGNENANIDSNSDELHLASDTCNTDMENNVASTRELSGDISMSTHSMQSDNPLAIGIVSENMEIKDMQNAMNNTYLTKNEVPVHLNSVNQESETNSSLNLKNDHLKEITRKNEITIEDNFKTDLQTSLPDILSTLKKPTNRKLQEQDNSCESRFRDNIGIGKESPKPRSVSSQTSNIQYIFSSDAMHNEMEMELKELQSLKANQANQSIYKLAYDENVTDQSENSMSPSRSPSPVNPISQIPSSFTQHEIIVHEADSDDDAGSEDVELIPHRYESESYLNKIQNKNVYVNKLSLAVELLRTQENLPYDGEFKRIVGENNTEPCVHTGGKVNFGFRKDSGSPEKTILTKTITNTCEFNTRNRNEIISQRQINPSPDNSSDSAIFSDIDINSFENEICEPTNDVVSQGNGNQNNTEEIRTGYRRFGIQAHRQFSPLPFNPCFCCIVM